MATELKAPTIGGNITPQMPKEPPKEVLEQTFSLDPSIKIGEHSGQTISNEDGKNIEPVVTPKVEEEVKPATETKIDTDVPVKEEVNREEVKIEEAKKEVD